MKILLTSPVMSYEDRWGQYVKGAGDTFPQGIGSIGGYLESQGYDVDILEPDIKGLNAEGFKKLLSEKIYDVIGISAFTPNVAFAFKTAKLIREALANSKIVIGGSHPTLFPERTLEECPELDFLVIKEGEIPFSELCACLANKNTDFSNISNLYYRDTTTGKIRKSEKDSDWLDLDTLPMFPYHKFDMELYKPAPSLRKVLPTFNYMAQRGCPFKCSFCDTRTHGRKVRYRSVDKVIDDLKRLKNDFGAKGLIFEGSNFTVKSSWIEELCNKMLKENLNMQWYCMGRVDLNTDLIPLMREAGLWSMSFGIESGNPDTLKRMHKEISVEKVKNTLSILKKNKIRSIGSFILGYPGENVEKVLNTINYACSLPLDVAVFFIPVPFPGTGLLKDAMEFGGMKNANPSWEAYGAWLDHNNPIYENPLLEGRHVELYNYAFRKFYGRPSFILRQITGIKNINDFRRLFQGFQSVKTLMLKGLKHTFMVK